MEFFIGFLVAGVIMGLFASLVAGEKGYSAGAWFVLGLFFSIVALLASVGLPDKKARPKDV